MGAKSNCDLGTPWGFEHIDLCSDLEYNYECINPRKE